MDKFAVDYQVLGQKMTERKVYRFEDVKDRLVKVAFDVVRFREDDNIDGLWQIQATDDGELIVAMYEEEPGLESKSNDWAAVADKTGSVINVFYKTEPVMKFAASSVGIEDVSNLVETLPKSLSENTNLRQAMLNELPLEEKAALLAKYPELNK